jgi:hypothetical protein
MHFEFVREFLVDDQFVDKAEFNAPHNRSKSAKSGLGLPS